MKQHILTVLSVLLVLLSLYYVAASNLNLGSILVWLITGICILYTVFWRKVDAALAKTLWGHILLGFLLLICVVVCVTLAVIVSRQVDNTATGEENTLVVLGCAVHGEKPSLVLEYRLRAALEFYEKNPMVTIVVCGGKGHDEKISEALAMQRWLVQHGVPENQIIMEDKSTSTEENFRFAAKLLQQNGIDPAAPVAYVTNGFHCYRAGKYAEREGFVQSHAMPAGLPVMQMPACYLREICAVLFYWVFRMPAAA